jgi:PAP2 superfamily
MKKYNILITSIIFSLIFGISSCDPKDPEPPKPSIKTVKDYSADITYAWNSLYVSIIKHTPGYRPPVSARALAHIGLAAYESVAPGMKDYQSIAANFPTLKIPAIETGKTYHWGVSANAAYLYSIRSYIQNINAIDFKKADSIANFFNAKYQLECDTETFARSKKFGEDVGNAVYLYSVEDGQTQAFANNKPLDYMPPRGEDKWQSTIPDFLPALTPTWGRVRTFFFNPNDLKAVDPIKFSTDKTSEFYKEAMEVYNAVKNKTTESKWVAEFWSDDLHTYTVDAAGRWIMIADAYMKEKKVDLETAIFMDAKMGILLHDAAVACWKEKYTYNLLRPTTYIIGNIEQSWRPILRDPTKPIGQQIGVTPQHPSYPSGHSVFGAAAAEILIATFGDKIVFTDRTHENENYFDGRPRSFTSFTAMANENAFSRIPLGVHYRMDCVEGLRLGKLVGQRINAVSWKKTLQ